jgi:hypothetical protein
LMAYYRRLDEGSHAAALAHLENVLAHSARGGRLWQHAIFLEAAYVSANIRKQVAQARTWRERAYKLRKPESPHAVEASIAMCEGRYEDAAGHWAAEQSRVLRRRLDSGIVRCAKEQWAEYEAACRNAIAHKGETNLESASVRVHGLPLSPASRN